MFTGADTEQLNDLERELTGLIGRYEAALHRDNSFVLQLASIWAGPFAASFLNTWTTVDRAMLTTALDGLSELRQRVATNRGEQDTTSNVDTARVLSGSTAFAGVRPLVGKPALFRGDAELGLTSGNAPLLGPPAPPVDVTDEKGALNDALDNFWGNDEEAIWRTLEGLTPAERAALRNDAQLMERLNNELGRGDRARAMSMLGLPEQALTIATDGLGTDERAVRETIRRASPAERAQIRANPALMDKLRSDLTGSQMEEVNDLLDPNRISVHFDGEVVTALDANGNVLESWGAVSGVVDSNGATQPELEGQKAGRSGFLGLGSHQPGGPVPEGRWQLEPSEQQRRADDPDFWKSRRAQDWGDSRTIIRPKEWTDTLNRTELFTHGGEDPGAPGSAGCVDFFTENDGFQQWLGAQDGPVELVVDYDNYGDDYSTGID